MELLVWSWVAERSHRGAYAHMPRAQILLSPSPPNRDEILRSLRAAGTGRRTR